MQNIHSFGHSFGNGFNSSSGSPFANCSKTFAPQWASQPGTEPMYKTISNWLRSEILRGRFAEGDKLPSVRTLVTDFGVSHPTVLRALEELAALGYVKLVKGSGTFVADHCSELNHPKQQGLYVWHNPQPTVKRSLEPHANSHSLPIAQWQRCMRSAVSDITTKTSPGGLPALRRAIAAFTRRSRGVLVDESQIFILPGLSSALLLAADLCLSGSAIVAAEDPGSAKVIRLLSHRAAKLEPIALDSQGISIEQLKAFDGKIDLLHVTPNQNPTGLVMSDLRRQSLLNWASHVGTFVLEDDFGGHMMLAAHTETPLFSRNTNSTVIYLGGFSSSLHPLVQTTYLFLPTELAERAWHSTSLRDIEQNLLEQQALLQMLEDGHLELHLKRSKKLLMEKRALMISALKQTLGSGVQISAPNINGKQMVKFRSDIETRSITTAALRSGLPLVSAAGYYVQREHCNEFMLSFDELRADKVFDTVLHFAGLLK